MQKRLNNISLLKNNDLKVTEPRLKILNLFADRIEQHLSAEEVYRILLDEGFEIGIATIYRVLTQFEQAGILLRHHFESGKAIYELNHSDHDHIMCIKCSKITEFQKNKEMERLQAKIAEEYDYQLVDHALYLYGVCSVCQQKSKR